MEESVPLLYLAGTLALGILAQWFAWKLHMPAIVLLLAFGFVIGIWLNPDDLIGTHILFPVVSLAVAIILFEGGLSLRFQEIRDTGHVVLRLVTLGVIVTWALTALAAYTILGFEPKIAALAGALLTVSGPTVIIPILRTVRPEPRIGSLVKWEGIVNDPVGAVLAALVFESVVHAHGFSALGLFKTTIVGILLGWATAALLVQIEKRYLVPDFLRNAVFLAMVVLAFSISNHLQTESGLITVTLAGVLLANQKSVTVRHVVEFKENLRVLLISSLFIVLASRLRLQQLMDLGWRGFLFLIGLLLIIRPAAVFISTIGTGLGRREKLFLSWLAPRGIVAAAVSSLFALELSRGNDPDMARQAEQLVSVTFLVIVGTVVVYGLSAAPLARRFQFSRQNPQGILFAGARPVVREIANAVQNEGFQVLLIDTNHRHIAAARMAGLPVCYASIVSEYVLEELDLGELGRLVAMTPNDQINTMASLEFAETFGRSEVYQLASTDAGGERHEAVAAHRRGREAFGPEATFDYLTQRFVSGARVKKTKITDDFSYEDFRKRYGDSALVLFIQDSGNLTVCISGRELTPRSGQTLIYLVDPSED